MLAASGMCSAKMVNAEEQLQAVFEWKDMASYAPTLLGPNASPSDLIESPLGSSIRYPLPEDRGSGWLEFLELNDPIRILLFDCHWRETNTVRVRDEEWVRFNFSISIDIFMTMSGQKNAVSDASSWRIINNPTSADTIEEFPGGTKTTWVTICCKPEYIAALCGCSEDDIPHPLRNDFYEDNPQTFHELYDFTSRLNAITMEILRTNLTGGLRISYIHARARELLCLALEKIMNPAPDVTIPVKLNEQDMEALEKARGILVENCASPPSVKELSLLVGVNRNKLFYGFRSVFGKTISEFIQDHRLVLARDLLESSSQSISDISAAVGFKHQCNFSTAVKKHFGMTPLKLREAARVGEEG